MKKSWGIMEKEEINNDWTKCQLLKHPKIGNKKLLKLYNSFNIW